MIEKIKLKNHLMNMDYNKLEHLELLLKKLFGLLNNKDYLEYFSKLIKYSTMTNDHLNWSIHEHYLDLLKNFRKKKIQTFEFCTSFEDTGKLTSDISDILESSLIILSFNEK